MEDGNDWGREGHFFDDLAGLSEGQHLRSTTLTGSSGIVSTAIKRGSACISTLFPCIDGLALMTFYALNSVIAPVLRSKTRVLSLILQRLLQFRLNQ